ncbi:MAG: serine/threonine protein kinase [Bryobacteraceae bacterium]
MSSQSDDGQSGSILDSDAFEVAKRMLDSLPEPIRFEDFGPYRIERLIGKGGMGEVFLAKNEAADRWVAIKSLRHEWAEPGLRERFTREIKTLGRLEHSYIARLYEAGVHPNGTPYFVMEYVEGKPLDEYCRERKCSVEERLRLFYSVCEAVQYAHSRLVVHRDLKPSNIFIKEDGTPKLLDFGIAKQLENLDEAGSQTQTELRFTRAYAAPEQLRREPVGVYTDVYTLGVILYELLAQKPPFDFEECTPVEAEIIITSERNRKSLQPRQVRGPTRQLGTIWMCCA